MRASVAGSTPAKLSCSPQPPASTAIARVVRPEFFENSVSPIPTMQYLSLRLAMAVFIPQNARTILAEVTAWSRLSC